LAGLRGIEPFPAIVDNSKPADHRPTMFTPESFGLKKRIASLQIRRCEVSGFKVIYSANCNIKLG